MRVGYYPALPGPVRTHSFIYIDTYIYVIFELTELTNCIYLIERCSELELAQSIGDFGSIGRRLFFVLNGRGCRLGLLYDHILVKHLECGIHLLLLGFDCLFDLKILRLV